MSTTTTQIVDISPRNFSVSMQEGNVGEERAFTFTNPWASDATVGIGLQEVAYKSSSSGRRLRWWEINFPTVNVSWLTYKTDTDQYAELSNLTLVLSPYESRDLYLRIGGESLQPGEYTAKLWVYWAGGYSGRAITVPVTCSVERAPSTTTSSTTTSTTSKTTSRTTTSTVTSTTLTTTSSTATTTVTTAWVTQEPGETSTTRTMTTTTTTTLEASPVTVVETIESSLVMNEEPDEDMQDACQAGIANTLGVNEDQVEIQGVEQETGRRLAGGWVIKYQVTFETVEDESGSPASSGNASAASALTKLQTLATDANDLVSAISTALESKGISSTSLSITAAEPEPIVTQEVAWVGTPWALCVAADQDPVVCGEPFTGTQSRSVWCADIATGVAVAVDNSLCAGITTLLSSQSCTDVEECEVTSTTAENNDDDDDENPSIDKASTSALSAAAVAVVLGTSFCA